jgi:hypothetical protein
MDSVRSLIQRAIEKQVEEILTEESAGLKKRVEERVRSQVGFIAARVLERFSMEMRGPRLVIEVSFENTQA